MMIDKIKYLSPIRYLAILSFFVILLILTLLICPTIGPTKISISKAFDKSIPRAENSDYNIFIIRFSRVLLAMIVGGVLASAGVVFQSLLKNPLATPYTLGISGGASLGAVIAINLQLDFAILGFSTLPIAAFLGSLVSIFFVYSLTRTRNYLSTAILLLAGVTANYFFSAIILFIQYKAQFGQTIKMIRWMMGGLDVVNFEPIIKILPFVVIGFVLLFLQSKKYNLLSLDRDTAISLGVNVERTQKLVFFAASLTTAAVISVSGPIGFVGLIIPHTLRLIIGSDHRLLFPSSFLFGGVFLAVCDTIARTIMSPDEIPVGVITAMLGGPFFIYLLLSKKQNFL